MEFSFIPFLIILFPYECFSQSGVAITYRRTATQIGIHMNTAFTFDSFNSTSVGLCAMICANRTLCKSLNFHSKNNTCQLNTLTLKDLPTGKVADQDSIYMDKNDIKRNDQCSTHTCSEAEACVINSQSAMCSKLDYKECSSTFPTTAFTIVSSSCKTSTGSVCTLVCKENYKSFASGISGYMICLPSGDWSVMDPKCELWIFDCQSLKATGYNTSGVYNITVKGEETEAYCDMETEGGGWTIVTNRFDGSLDFNQSWNTYKFGFGSSRGEYWLGNEYFHSLTWKRNYGAYFKLQTWGGVWYWAWYTYLYLHSEENGYKINFRGYKGNAGQTLDLGTSSGGTIQGMRFSTYDKDQDLNSGNFAKGSGGGWWFKYWAYCALTTSYGSNGYTWRDIGKLRASAIMVRPVH